MELSVAEIFAVLTPITSRLLLLLAKASFGLHYRSVWGLLFMSQHFQAPWLYRQDNPGAYRFCQ